MSDRNQNEAPPDKAESTTIQDRVEDFFNTIFGKWGNLLAFHPCKVFWLSMLFFILLSGGMATRKGYEDEQLIWTPADNPSLTSRDKSMKLFPSKSGFVSLIAEVKDPSDEGASIITLAAMKEIKEYVDLMQDAKADINGTEVKWSDIVNKMAGSESLLKFSYANG